ncbi:hypothetical protein E2C01_079220 [Portunus trituberculatus]|uniref:Uncharacterized protein n=1 Tax=Portunus trituberculatus TaxID=210409 RepID=A0A5B7IGE1_PORTR|nr:hypothetical protein [Portunus trituberculatus]
MSLTTLTTSCHHRPPRFISFTTVFHPSPNDPNTSFTTKFFSPSLSLACLSFFIDQFFPLSLPDNLSSCSTCPSSSSSAATTTDSKRPKFLSCSLTSSQPLLLTTRSNDFANATATPAATHCQRGIPVPLLSITPPH